VARQALNAMRLTIGELAGRLALPRETLAAYMGGERRTPAPVAPRLAAVLRQHAVESAALAAELDDVT
jgi:plasmid maintenance system antidote protein VapI